MMERYVSNEAKNAMDGLLYISKSIDAINHDALIQCRETLSKELRGVCQDCSGTQFVEFVDGSGITDCGCVTVKADRSKGE